MLAFCAVGMQEFWLLVHPDGTFDPKQGVYVDSSVAPAESPAAPGHPIVPEGYVRQIAQNGSQDNVLPMNGSFLPQITQFCVPYVSGGWPPDPLAGEPGHTMQDWDGRYRRY
jgi:hypothetical protein